MRSTEHEAPCYAVFSIPLLLHPYWAQISLKCKLVPVHRGSRAVAPAIIFARIEWSALRPNRFTPGKRLVGPQGLSGRSGEEKRLSTSLTAIRTSDCRSRSVVNILLVISFSCELRKAILKRAKVENNIKVTKTCLQSATNNKVCITTVIFVSEN